ncbi:MAG: ferrous iron transport protein A [Rhodothermales bacterium]|nr:ferrous iron transport protein A [Rhodothermales bacterium]MBO6778165.1 ferrous iron transport protein A [Rhodothermales bacterium]
MSLKLDQLKPGETGRIDGFTDASPSVRLLELGLLPGTQVEVVRLAPLGDPMDLKVRGFHVSLRKSEAACILVSRA